MKFTMDIKPKIIATAINIYTSLKEKAADSFIFEKSVPYLKVYHSAREKSI
jgi:hypothetical protein